MFSISVIFATIASWLQAAVWPILLQFGGWIAAGAGAILAWLFSPTIRKYTIAAIAVLVILLVVWLNGYSHGRSHGDSVCSNPKFHQITLPPVKGKYPVKLVADVKEHNDLGASLGCWSNSNIR